MAKDNESGISDDYLNSVADLPADNAVEGTTVETDGGQGGERVPGVNQQTDHTARGGEGQDAGQVRQDTKTKTPAAGTDQQQQQAPADGQAPRLRRHASGQYVDEEGNITNEKGEIIAPRGPARRLHEQNVRLQRDYDSAQQELQQLRIQAQGNNLLNGIPQQFGLTQQEVASALDWSARIKRGDALGVARDVIAMLAAKGHNISELVGNNVGDAIDMRALKAMIDERLAPLDQQQRERQATTEQEQAAQTAYNNFIRVNEYADVHGDVIVAMMKTHNVGQQQAYNMVRDFAVRNNLDMSQPLGPQIEAIQQQVEQERQQQQPPNNQQQQPNTRPMPNGATRSSGVEQIAPTFADPNDTWADIIRTAMGEGSM